jgi:hypothetical protein
MVIGEAFTGVAGLYGVAKCMNDVSEIVVYFSIMNFGRYSN